MATLLSVAETLLTTLQSSTLKEICSIWGLESELQGLKHTVSTITGVLLDVEAKEELPDETRECIQKLQDAVYDADDLFDELLTIADQRKGRVRGAKLSAKVREFFSADTMSQLVKDIRNQLNAMVSNPNKFSFEVDYQAIREGGEDLFSDVIGRKDDVNAIIHLLLEPEMNYDVSVLTIMGVPGSGKTTLAQLVYEDDRVESEFAWRLWINVFNGNGEEFNVREILGKILESCGYSHSPDSDMLSEEIPHILGQQKNLIVLDDVCIKDQHKWLALKKFFMFGCAGSRILITTSSEETARVIGSEHTYELKGLSRENLWRLFETAAFGKEQDHFSHPELVEIGKKIVEEWYDVPLAIKAVTSLLFGQDITKCRLFEQNALAAIDRGEKNLVSLLKLSYHNLESSLKSCFTYCKLFPKGFVIEKRKLISLWMAQGYILPLIDGQSMEDAGEEYFSILLRRCFLQPIARDVYGEVVSCIIPNFMHEVALEVAAHEVCVVDSIMDNLGDNIRHLYHVGSSYSEKSFPKFKIRSFLHQIVDRSFPPLDGLISSWACLRALDLHCLRIKSLPDSISKLLHLRYLDLSDNDLQRLPSSITKLHNLQTLNLKNNMLKELPRDLSKLVNLRSLNIDPMFVGMPSGMDKLTCLHVLSAFVVADQDKITEEETSSDEESSNGHNNPCFGKLEDLKALTNLRGSIIISILRNFEINENESEEGNKGGYLGSMEHLKEVSIQFGGSYSADALLERLQLHPYLKGITLSSYQATTISKRVTDLPNLVQIKIESCKRLQHLSLLRKFQHLRSLTIYSLDNLEYMEETTTSTSSSSNDEEPPSNLTFFPSLEYLKLRYLPKFKAWWRNDDNSSSCWKPSFIRLCGLFVTDCPRLKSFPPCPRAKTFHLGRLDRNFQIMHARDCDRLRQANVSENNNVGYVRSLRTENVDYLKSLTAASLTSIYIENDENVKSLSEVGEALKRCSSSLRRLRIHWCEKLSSLSGGLEYLTSLESLSISDCSDLIFSDEESDDGMPWRSLHQSLRSLQIAKIEDLAILPRGMGYLTSLQNLEIECCYSLKEFPQCITCLSSLKSLRINFCDEFKSLPEGMQNLTSLKLLHLSHCSSGLMKRCQNPKGEDWPKIQHIPSIIITGDSQGLLWTV